MSILCKLFGHENPHRFGAPPGYGWKCLRCGYEEQPRPQEFVEIDGEKIPAWDAMMAMATAQAKVDKERHEALAEKIAGKMRAAAKERASKVVT